MSDPNSSGIRVENRAAFSCWVYVKSSAHESEHSGLLMTGQDYTFLFADLAKNGFQEGENCWMSVDVQAGKTNHESRENFNLAKDGGFMGTYSLTGGTLTPAWHREF
ncbi:hypothetical protein FOPG_17303 [Fusarium oxysporum f. sp. conglutinans race 2 54008]|uniref:Uncharacterized protein n=2 Tax=Fusarium oxysporum TaxID=5507 RepID=A0A4Q2V5A6_FUSOX|nr:hypothetical protein FOPG_17303 [Fusarium oxysporum f. sp. conglutinans race 2 54008]KAK2469225.1 hypothetical protein H9L39_19206 [Fusarium oxysporum f. sp. albedinis]RKL06069.1 hypothetical protein BFJ70_g17054 [Fusarium oxysporum]RYC79828.1 hypothetical protein BFJ63_vAg17289 [Fusarium oxysporum f. sp. narcissi]